MTSQLRYFNRYAWIKYSTSLTADFCAPSQEKRFGNFGHLEKRAPWKRVYTDRS
jgi:hypothetical protein